MKTLVTMLPPPSWIVWGALWLLIGLPPPERQPLIGPSASLFVPPSLKLPLSLDKECSLNFIHSCLIPPLVLINFAVLNKNK